VDSDRRINNDCINNINNYNDIKANNNKTNYNSNNTNNHLNINRKNKHIILSGGVASNDYITEFLTKELAVLGWNVLRPQSDLCTDNGAMIAWACWERVSFLKENNDIQAQNNLQAHPRWTLSEDSFSCMMQPAATKK
jgi:tRNA A37 threonylcarbamoyltransferase TsaD